MTRELTTREIVGALMSQNRAELITKRNQLRDQLVDLRESISSSSPINLQLVKARKEVAKQVEACVKSEVYSKYGKGLDMIVAGYKEVGFEGEFLTIVNWEFSGEDFVVVKGVSLKITLSEDGGPQLVTRDLTYVKLDLRFYLVVSEELKAARDTLKSVSIEIKAKEELAEQTQAALDQLIKDISRFNESADLGADQINNYLLEGQFSEGVIADMRSRLTVPALKSIGG